ncbi:hypothetical protein O2V63_12090 [Modestobacter sp. VKM Ac-2977]|uniref:hypothetical protein n=1 Tax=Modestobacter sp. VKM Ac-2977 TaxID=3004131 RepID=UPI0022AA829D|nr:hypothetical protein [Modestobacter sp. VKM Ac-2977]MCZ2821073.1 hypothetical protein [Modestobacter sp. VKM Ac-2977]
MRLRSTAVATVLFAGISIPMAGTALAADVYNCDDYAYQEDAQAVFDQDTTDPNQLDDDDDSLACETLPSRGTSAAGDTDDDDDAQVTTRPSGSVAAGDGSSAAEASALPYVLGGLAFAGASGAAVAARRSSRTSA